jgi:chloride channel protein, CIC family
MEITRPAEETPKIGKAITGSAKSATRAEPRPPVRFPGSRSRLVRTLFLSILVGITAGSAAKLLESSVALGSRLAIGRIADPASTSFFHFDWRVSALPALGGLVSGLLLGVFTRPTRAHGTAVLIDAFHHGGAALPFKDSLLKAVGAAVLICLGGSVGKEAPIAVLSASMGTTLAALLKLSPRERRLFLIAGCAGGVGAIFQCPLGGAIFAVTVLYREPEIESDALFPAIIASVTSYSTFMLFGGSEHHLLTGLDRVSFDSPRQLVAYFVLAVFCALVGILFHYSLRASAWAAHASRLPRSVTPAIAGLAGGIIACAVPQVMDSRYLFIQKTLEGASLLSIHSWQIWALLFALVLVAKCFATSLMMGAESAGGLFGPILFMGGIAGALVGSFLESVAPSVFSETLRQALIPVGMAGLLAACLRTPLAAIVMVTEMTGSYRLIVPLMLVTMVAYILGRRWGVYAEQISGPGDSPAHAGESVISILELGRAKDLADPASPLVVSPATRMSEMAARVPVGARPAFAVVDGTRLVGTISAEEFSNAMAAMEAHAVLVAMDLASPHAHAIYAEDDLFSTLDLYRRWKSTVLPVVDGDNGQFVGMLSRASILGRLKQEMSRQHAHMVREHEGIADLANASVLETLLSELSESGQGRVRHVRVPPDGIGKSLKELGYRQRYGAHVIAVESATGSVESPPDPNRPLGAEEYLVVVTGPGGAGLQREAELAGAPAGRGASAKGGD